MTQGSGQFRKGYAGRPVLDAREKIPVVAVTDESGQVRQLNQELASGWALVYFYPRANTPGCTRQACSLRDAYEDLAALGVAVFGVSTDRVERQRRFRERRKLPFTLLADPEKKVVSAFGVPTTFGFAARMAFLFRDGVLVWRDLKASTRQQAADVLAIVRQAEGE